MVTFFTIFFFLVVLNAAVLMFTALDARKQLSIFTKRIKQVTSTELYPMDLIQPKYKKAI